MDKTRLWQLAKKIWDYHHMCHELEKADCILVLGSHDTRVAEWGAELYLQGFAPMMVMSGGLGRLTRGMWQETEAAKFAAIAIAKGVPPKAILIEDRSSNTGENILFTQQLLQQQGLDPQRYILVQKPYMERRSYATFKKHLPHKEVIVTSPRLSLETYVSEDLPLEKVVHIMVGDLQRIKFYPEKGFQIYQHIPGEVWQAYEELVAMGFTGQLLREEG